jgi:hypothetical protein
VTSTALDAVVAVLLIGAAIAALPGTPGPPASVPPAEPTLQTLLTATTTVGYAQSPETGSTGIFEDSARSVVERTSSGSYGELLTQAAIATLAVDGRPVTSDGDGFRHAVDGETRSLLPPRTQVAVRWRPYPDAHLGARLTVGPTPPRDADLSGASTSVPSGFPAAGAEARSAARADGYAGVSRVLADRIVAGLFPPGQTAAALQAGYPTAPLVAHRYGRFGDAYGVDLAQPVSDQRVSSANRRLAAALAERIETELRARFDSPEAAARVTTIDHVDLVVRRWA